MSLLVLLLLAQSCGYTDYNCVDTQKPAGYTDYQVPTRPYTALSQFGYSIGQYGKKATATGCRASDGDTLNCASGAGPRNRLRLTGIDAPELPGHCAKSRKCAPGDPYASQRALQRFIGGRTVRYDDLGRDRYGRRIALAKVGNTNLNCYLVRNGYAVYKKEWDNRRALWHTCSYVRQHYRF